MSSLGERIFSLCGEWVALDTLIVPLQEGETDALPVGTYKTYGKHIYVKIADTVGAGGKNWKYYATVGTPKANAVLGGEHGKPHPVDGGGIVTVPVTKHTPEVPPAHVQPPVVPAVHPETQPPVPTPPVKLQPQGMDPSKAVTVKDGPEHVHAQAIKDAFKIIASVHGLGLPPKALPNIPVRSSVDLKKVSGAYLSYAGNIPNEIVVSKSPSNKSPELTFVHEFGHYLDYNATGTPQHSGSKHSKMPEYHAVMKAMDDSQAIQTLNKPSPVVPAPLRTYLLKRYEMFARAYAQYIATRSQNPLLLQQLKRYQSSSVPMQWSDEDFKPIGEAMDGLFKKLGWVK